MLFLDYQDSRPIYEQIVEKFRMLILSGAVEPSSKMPSVRQLAVELSINPNTCLLYTSPSPRDLC